MPFGVIMSWKGVYIQCEYCSAAAVPVLQTVADNQKHIRKRGSCDSRKDADQKKSAHTEWLLAAGIKSWRMQLKSH